MFQSFNFGQIFVVTKKQELVKMTERYFGKSLPLKALNECSNNLFCGLNKSYCNNKSTFCVLDTDILKNRFSLAEESKINTDKFVCFVPRNASLETFDFYKKNFGAVVPYPCTYEVFKGVLDNCTREKAIENRNHKQSEAVENSESSIDGFFVGKSKKIKDVCSKIREVSFLQSPVLLLGETGTGKTTAAKLIHKYSERKENPFVSVNMATIVDSLAESTLFGSNKGGFTDAINQDGLIKLADKGTLFFDELSCTSVNTQSKLLTFIETQKIVKVGGKLYENVDVRMIFATNSDLYSLMQEGKFRTDLYFRISDNIITIPSLRERPEDIREIVENFLKNKNVVVDEKSYALLESYDWPGNIRELHKCLTRAINSCENNIIRVENIDFGLFG